MYAHEYKVGQIARDADNRLIKMMINRVKESQLQHRDYRAWYYQPVKLAEQSRADRLERDKQYHYENPPVVPDIQD